MIQRKNIKKVYFGNESLSSLAPKIWKLVWKIKLRHSIQIKYQRLQTNDLVDFARYTLDPFVSLKSHGNNQ